MQVVALSATHVQLFLMMECGGWVEELHSLREEADLQSGGRAAGIPVSLNLL